MIFKKD